MISQNLIHSLESAGLDLICPFDISDYHQLVTKDHNFQSKGYGVLIGNTHQLWKPFVKWLSQDDSRIKLENPLDSYVEQLISTHFRDLPVKEIRFSHLPDPHHIGFVKLAHAAQLAFENQTGLCIHPVYGPWIALRCAVILDEDPKLERLELKSNPCNACKSHCIPAYFKAMDRFKLKQSTVEDWLEIRKSCPLGIEYAYDDNQTLYHYSKDKRYLVQALTQLF